MFFRSNLQIRACEEIGKDQISSSYRYSWKRNKEEKGLILRINCFVGVSAV
jgi:hypothetical protein